MLSRLRHLARDETGAYGVMIALLIPVFLLLGVFAVDVSNWYVHHRKLQIQADAGALAGAAYYKYPCTDAPIAAAAQSYAGQDHNAFSDIPTSRLTFRLNRDNYVNQSTPGDTGLTGSPCADMAVDVKMTEQNIPMFFGNLFNPLADAQARVEIRRLLGGAPMIPVGVPASDPKRVRVTFISEVTGETLGVKDLCESTPANGLSIWDNAATNPSGYNSASSACDKSTTPSTLPLTFNDPKFDRVGVIVAVSGSLSTINCGQPLVSCYRSSTSGLGFVHGWSDTPAVTDPTANPTTTGSAPQPRSVWLLPGTCGDAYFNTATTSCTIGVSAKVDFQPREYDASGNPRMVGNGGSAQPVIAVNAIVGTSTYPMTFNTTTKTWSAASVTIPPGGGVSTVQLSWEQKDNAVTGFASPCTTVSNGANKNACAATFPNVLQRTVSANPTVSGPLQLLQIGDLTNTSGVDDVQECSSSHASCTTNFVVRVGVSGTLALSQPNDPPIVLRVGGGGSQNQSIDCDPNVSNLKDELALGCAPDYRRNTGQACPANSVFGTAQPWYCVGAQTGATVNQVAAGMNHRVLGSEKPTACTNPNHWPDYQPSDPRIVPLFVVPFGSFQGTGNDTFPIQDFAYFYVTGWVGQGGGFDNPCQGNGDDPVVAGSITGHFIKYVATVGKPDDAACDLNNSISGCVAVMTR
jgi:hypothetical protein